MTQLIELHRLRDIAPERIYRFGAATGLGTCSDVGTEYVTIDTISNDVVFSRNAVAWIPKGPICIDGACGGERTGLAQQVSDHSDWPRLFERLEALRRLKPDWNGYGSMPPNAMAEARAHAVLLELHKLNRIPERVVASADDGVGIYITSGQKYAMIECYNDGGIVIGVSDREGNIRNWEIESYIIRAGLEEALAFLDG